MQTMRFHHSGDVVTEKSFGSILVTTLEPPTIVTFCEFGEPSGLRLRPIRTSWVKLDHSVSSGTPPSIRKMNSMKST